MMRITSETAVGRARTQRMRRMLFGLTATALGLVSAVGSSTPALAGSPQEIGGVVTCKNATVAGVYVKNSTGDDGWASLGTVVEWGGLNSATYSFTQQSPGSYHLVVGCGTTLNGEWGTVLYSDSTSEPQTAWACNDLHPAWGWVIGRVKALTLWRAVAYSDVEYGRCEQV